MKTVKKSFFLLFGFFFLFIFAKITFASDYVGQWILTSNLPFNLANHPTTAIFNKLFTFGGSTSFVRSDSISSSILADGSLFDWETTTSTSLPVGLFWHSLVNNGVNIYILGGTTYPPENSVNNVLRGSFDPFGNITGWTEMTPLPKRLSGGSAVLVGNTIYYSGGGTWSGGWGGLTLSNVIYINKIDSSGNLGLWQTNPVNLPRPLVQHTLVETGKKIVLIGGSYSPWSPSNEVYSAPINPDGTLESWTPLDSLKIPVRYPMVGKVGDLVIVAGGVSTSWATDKVYYSLINSDGDTGQWTLSANKLPKINCCTGSAVWNNTMYITGGHNNTDSPNNYYDTVWYAKINYTSPVPTSTPTPTPPTPVVFLPGLGGSINFKEMFLGQSDPTKWKMTPGANVYDNLLKAFEGNSNFYVFYYDWRKPVLETAQKLNNYIHTTVNPWNNKVDLVGHSLGGLVARTCVQKTENNCYVNKLITVGSPHFGAVDSYPALEGGEIWRTGPIKLGYELLVHYFQRPGEIRKETIQRIAPVLKDLLPNFNYLTKNGINLPPSDLSIKNSLLPELQILSSLENKTKTITGRGFNSIEKIILTEPNWIDKLLGNWPDGKPTDKQFTLEGDTSVLVKSSSFTNPLIENFTYDLDHGGIISEKAPLSKIMELLDLELKAGTYDSLNDEENFLVFFVHSPVKISSPDTTPDSYTVDELIIIPSPTNKNYTLNVEGTENGFYSLSVGQIGTESASWQDYYGEAQIGKTQNFEFDINIENPPEDPLLNNQIFHSLEFDTLLNQCKNLTNSQISNQKYKNIILSLLNLISKEKNNPEMALNYVNLLRNTIATLEKQGNLDSALVNQLRKYSSKMASYFEEKAFGNPKITLKTQADSYFNSAKTMLDQMEVLHNFSKTATLIFLEAKEKLSEAQNYLNLERYYQTKILAKNITGLLLEVKILSR
ncbi:hypothetical protein COS55_02635 [Candidatus Shapirobacteria bacterium CG03_land_8_20_14_0_80_40_19]|uniref:PGAP1 family protein n=1 Tax=Candidatus Shapirobacteria bacterium CG03_land_8_20_14_0_80_40_19 TaxID=1974880 RepID=A0A2M7BD72_9BACT|nr:MAG: hypothetical protein COS55_02635 [Candidatus Shapirobacteria bacterium CG03_land_8_20_14_0_80_40_19]